MMSLRCSSDYNLLENVWSDRANACGSDGADVVIAEDEKKLPKQCWLVLTKRCFTNQSECRCFFFCAVKCVCCHGSCSYIIPAIAASSPAMSSPVLAVISSTSSSGSSIDSSIGIPLMDSMTNSSPSM